VARKGWPDVLKNVHVTAATGNQWISYQPFISEGMRSSCAPDHTMIETLDGKPVKDRRNPRAAFDGHTVETPWDDLHLAYFSGYAMWNYLTNENSEKRRRLKVAFPDYIATHCTEQIFHINGEGLICRVDYSAPVAGGAPTAHYLSEHRDFSGIKMATKRRALRRKADGTAIPEPVFVAIDIAELSFS
jgi:hypothetical protein